MCHTSSESNVYFWEIQSYADPALIVMDLQPEKFPERKLQGQETVRDSWKLKAKETITANCFFA